MHFCHPLQELQLLPPSIFQSSMMKLWKCLGMSLILQWTIPWPVITLKSQISIKSGLRSYMASCTQIHGLWISLKWNPTPAQTWSWKFGQKTTLEMAQLVWYMELSLPVSWHSFIVWKPSTSYIWQWDQGKNGICIFRKCNWDWRQISILPCMQLYGSYQSPAHPLLSISSPPEQWVDLIFIPWALGWSGIHPLLSLGWSGSLELLWHGLDVRVQSTILTSYTVQFWTGEPPIIIHSASC